jgi:aminopeptidase Y
MHSTGSGCTEEQWAGIDATGKIALVKRGVCAIYEKLLLAKAHGALGVILWNQASGIPTAATLGAEHLGLIPPVGVIQMEVGLAWKARLAAGEDLVVNLLVDSIHDVRTSWNVFAETKEGDPNNVIMLGAHLDSVQAGPGINDDGSGTTALLEIASSIKKYKGFKNKIRLAWWGNEEGGLAGSLFYTSNLTEVEADKIRFYFNYDMIGSIEPIYEVYRDDGNVGSEIGSQILYDYLVAAGKPAEYGAFGTSSDYVGFREIGIPSSGLFTGAGAPEDPCYHLACDTTDNINSEALLINAQAAGAAAAEFALSLGDLPARSKTTINPRNRKQIRAEMTKWKRAAETAERGQGHTCSHKANNVV